MATKTRKQQISAEKSKWQRMLDLMDIKGLYAERTNLDLKRESLSEDLSLVKALIRELDEFLVENEIDDIFRQGDEN